MKVEPADIKNSQKRLVALKRRQNELVKAKEAEIKKIKESYNEEARYARQLGLQKLDQTRANNQQLLSQAIDQKNNKLEEVRNSIQTTQDFLLREEESLRENSKRQQDYIRQSSQDRINELKQQGIASSDKSNQELNETLSQIKSESDRAIKLGEQEARQRQSESQSALNIKLSNNKINNDKTIYRMQETMNEQQDKLNKVHQEQLQIQKSEQDLERQERAQIYQDSKKSTENLRQNKMLMEKQAFQEKYQTMVNDHKKVIERLTAAFDKQINDLGLAHHQKVSLTQSRAADNFYRNKLIEPQITEDAANYTLTLQVPEHEKDQYVISAHKRKIKLSFFRNYQDEVYQNSGERHSTKRTESLTRTFDVANIVDANKVTKTYQDNKLSFKIAKA